MALIYIPIIFVHGRSDIQPVLILYGLTVQDFCIKGSQYINQKANECLFHLQCAKWTVGGKYKNRYLFLFFGHGDDHCDSKNFLLWVWYSWVLTKWHCHSHKSCSLFVEDMCRRIIRTSKRWCHTKNEVQTVYIMYDTSHDIQPS